MPENQAYSDYIATRILAQAIAETGGTDTDTLVQYLESGVEFDVLKSRKGYFDKDTHQMLSKIYAVTALDPAQVKDRWNIFTTSDALPGTDQSLDVLTQGAVGGVCTFA